MDSEISENAPDGEDAIDRILDDADARIAQLARERAAIAERRRALAEPDFKVVAANPTEIHHKITLGGVMIHYGLAAEDADSLAGLLAHDAVEVFALCQEAIDEEYGTSFGSILVAAVDLHLRPLAARGQFETWCRRTAAYEADRSEWLERDEEYRLHGAWRDLNMTTDQRWLIRATCRIRRIDLPGHLSRGAAADWLEANGANLSYRDFVA